MPETVIVPDVSSLKAMEGCLLPPSDWLEVSQTMIDDFARSTGDQQWIHLDVDRARRESPFGGTIAHGYLTVALVSVLLPQILEVKGCTRVVNYGIDRLRLREPVPSGSRLRICGEIEQVRMVRGGAARTTLGLKWEVEGARRPVCQASVVYVYYP